MLPQLLQDFAEGRPLLRKVPGECPRAHAESLRDRCGPCLATGKQVGELVYHHTLQHADRVLFGKQVVGMCGQDLQ